MTWLLKVLGGGVGPYLVGMLAIALVGMGGTILWQRVEVAQLEVDVATCSEESAVLKGKVELQNREVERLAADCKAKSAAADVVAIRVINRAPPPAPGTGPQEMNRWFEQRLSSQ